MTPEIEKRLGEIEARATYFPNDDRTFLIALVREWESRAEKAEAALEKQSEYSLWCEAHGYEGSDHWVEFEEW